VVTVKSSPLKRALPRTNEAALERGWRGDNAGTPPADGGGEYGGGRVSLDVVSVCVLVVGSDEGLRCLSIIVRITIEKREGKTRKKAVPIDAVERKPARPHFVVLRRSMMMGSMAFEKCFTTG
jgi:hypothetical protein